MFNNKLQKLLVTFLLLIFNVNLVWSQADPGYYLSVDASTPSALKASLHNIIKDHTKIPYTSSSTDTWDVLELAGEDVDNSSRVIALYKNSDYTKVTGGNNNYNREHSWPKSYGFPNDNSSNYPYTDMHHLFIANSSYNSSRSNKPFDICVSGCTEKPTDVNNGRGGSGQSNFTKSGIWDVWQARQGDVARAMFYMAVRYEGGTHGITNKSEPDLELTDNLALINASQTGSNESQAYMGLLSVLITWHNSDPVDIYEHQHNEAVASGQGNRNPFIDHPEWVECVFELVCNGGGTDTTAPNAPNNLTGNAPSIGTITLDWFNNTESDLAGYNVYRSTSSGSGFSKLNSSLVAVSNYNDSSVSLNTTYYYRTTAQDNSGNESSNSSQISVMSQDNPPPTNNVLANGVAKTGLSGALNSQQNFTMTVPSGASDLSFNMSGGSGDADLYVRYGSAPTLNTYDCRPYIGGNSESCPISTAQAGTYYVMIVAYSAYSSVNLTGSYTAGSTNTAPTASFSYSCTDLSCSFNGANSTDSDGSISNYAWSFGGSGATTNNTFASAGTYSVTLTVTDNNGATDTATQSVTVTESTNDAPTASFSYSCTDLSCSFNGSNSTDSDGSISNYAWSFGGSGATTNNTFASAGTYSVTLTVTDNDGATDTATQSVTVIEAPVANNELLNGVTKTSLTGVKDSQQNFIMNVPAGATNLSFNMSGGSGDADLYVRFGSAPTLNTYDCRPYVGGNSESCPISTAQAGTYHVMIVAYSAYSSVSLTGSYTADGGGSVSEVFSSTTNVNIPDNNTSGATSNISVTRSGASGSVKITYSIVHTYQGDLTVQLIDPTGSATTLRSPSGGGTNDINESKTIDKGSTSANGTWGLKVIDGANVDTGHIDSWSIEFL